MSTTNPPPGSAPGAGPNWPADTANLSAPDDHGGGGGVDPAALKLGHEPDVFEVKPIMSIPFAVVVSFVIAFAVAAGVFAFVMAKAKEPDPRSHPAGLARGEAPLNERLARISQKGSTSVPSEVDAPRLETLQRLQGNDKAVYQVTTQPPVPTGNSPWIHPEELLPGRYAPLNRAEFTNKDKTTARIPIDDAMKLVIEKKMLPSAGGPRPQGVVDQPTNGNAGRGGLPKASEAKAAPKAAEPAKK
ncbi:MAG: hypothetical protein U0804_11370 [Gemmataceae bacterium]